MTESKKDVQGYQADWDKAVAEGAPKLSVVRTMTPVVLGGQTDDRCIAGANCELLDWRGTWLIRHRAPSPANAAWTVYKVGAGNQRQAY